MNIRILLADDHHIFRKGLKWLLDKEKDMEVVAEAFSGRDAIELAKKHKVHLAVVDITMRNLNGIEATKSLIKDNPEIKIIGLSMHSEVGIIKDMFAAGASAYLLKSCDIDEIANTIRIVANNQMYLTPYITDITINDIQKNLLDKNLASVLTTREREMLQLLAENNSVREIAEICNISFKTVENHRKNIMEKTNINTLSGLTKYAVRIGLTSLNET